jgi:hypothetical protein
MVGVVETQHIESVRRQVVGQLQVAFFRFAIFWRDDHPRPRPQFPFVIHTRRDFSAIGVGEADKFSANLLVFYVVVVGNHPMHYPGRKKGDFYKDSNEQVPLGCSFRGLLTPIHA